MYLLYSTLHLCDRLQIKIKSKNATYIYNALNYNTVNMQSCYEPSNKISSFEGLISIPIEYETRPTTMKLHRAQKLRSLHQRQSANSKLLSPLKKQDECYPCLHFIGHLMRIL